MAKYECPKCGHPVSREMKRCPNCLTALENTRGEDSTQPDLGLMLSDSKEMRRKGKIIVTVLILFVIALIIVLVAWNSRSNMNIFNRYINR